MRIEIPRLTALIVVSSVLTGTCYFLQDRVGLMFGALCEEIGCMFGPFLCLFLFLHLVAEIYARRGGHPWALLIGTSFGFGTFSVWLYEFTRH